MQRRLTDECSLTVSCAHQKKCVCLCWEKISRGFLEECSENVPTVGLFREQKSAW